MVEKLDGQITFPATNTSKIQLPVAQLLQNIF